MSARNNNNRSLSPPSASERFDRFAAGPTAAATLGASRGSGACGSGTHVGVLQGHVPVVDLSTSYAPADMDTLVARASASVADVCEMQVGQVKRALGTACESELQQLKVLLGEACTQETANLRGSLTKACDEELRRVSAALAAACSQEVQNVRESCQLEVDRVKQALRKACEVERPREFQTPGFRARRLYEGTCTPAQPVPPSNLYPRLANGPVNPQASDPNQFHPRHPMAQPRCMAAPVSAACERSSSPFSR